MGNSHGYSASQEDEFTRLIARFGADSDEALTALMGTLNAAGEIHARDPSSRGGAIVAMSALAWFTRKQGDERTAAMFAQLAGCLRDLDIGRCDAIFEAKKFGNRPPDSDRKQMVKIFALEAVKRICSMDQSAKKKDAQNTVAGWLTTLPDFENQKCDGQTLKNWQQAYEHDLRFDNIRKEFRSALTQANSCNDIRRGLERLGKPHS